ncbi:MAG: multiubiquitin domain-containing protein [Acidobacteria bacterium]|nr:multiubiquitin domain-containing protein [Acidobacteriota bacterium]
MTAKNPVPDKDDPGHKPFTIQIDRTKYEWSEEKISGAQLRSLPEPPIPRERDIFLVVPGHPDRKIKDDDTVEVKDGLRFFTAPNTINPGSSGIDGKPA